MTCIRLNHGTVSASAPTVRLAFSGSTVIPATPLLRRTSGYSDGITSGARGVCDSRIWNIDPPFVEADEFCAFVHKKEHCTLDLGAEAQ